MSAVQKINMAYGATLTAIIALAVGLSGCVTTGKSGKATSTPVVASAMHPAAAPDPMAMDPLFAAPPPVSGAAGSSSSGNGSERVPMGQVSGAEPAGSQRVPLGALSGKASSPTDAKASAPAKTTSAPLLIAPSAMTNAPAVAMNALPSAAPPTAKLPPVKTEPMPAPVPAKPEMIASSDVPHPKLEPMAATGGKLSWPREPVKAQVEREKAEAAKAAAAKAKQAKADAVNPPSPDKPHPRLKLSTITGGTPSWSPNYGDDETVVISSTTPVPSDPAREFIPASLSDVAQDAAAGGSMIDRPMTAAEKNVAQRFEVLKTLLDEGLITPEEYSRHRGANIGALLPFTHDPGSIGLDRPSAGPDAVVARLQALRRALEMRAITTQQHASERSMILMALLPAHPDDLAPPVPPPSDVIQGAAMVSRLQTLKTRGLISADEYESERKAIDQYLRTGTFKAAAAVADTDKDKVGGGAAAKDTKAGKKEGAAASAAGSESSDTAEVNGPVLHLASFRTKEAAEKAWQEALGQNKSILGAYRQIIRKIDLGQGKGVFYRLMVGPFTSLADAESICIRLKANNQFCRASSSASGS